MALLKKFQYPNGTETNYHKIGEIRIVPIADKIIYVEKEPEVVIEEVVGEEIPEELTLFNEGTEVVETIAEEPTEPTEVTETDNLGEGETGNETTTEGEPVKEPIEPELPEVPAVEYVPVIMKQVLIKVQVLSYVSQEIRETGTENALIKETYSFIASMEELVATDIMTLCYNFVKTLPEFADAEDI